MLTVSFRDIEAMITFGKFIQAMTAEGLPENLLENVLNHKTVLSGLLEKGIKVRED